MLSTPSASTGWGASIARHRVLRNTYALLSMTLLFSAAIAGLAVALQAPPAGLVITLVGYFGLLFLVHKLQHSGWAIPVVFALTGFMGYTLGPVLANIWRCPAARRRLRWPWARRARPFWPCRPGCQPRGATSASWAAFSSPAW